MVNSEPTPLPLFELHVSIHARGADVSGGAEIELRGQALQTLQVGVDELATPLSVSFEEALEYMERCERLFVEPDGSFVWTSSSEENTWWQLDGVLYDRGGRLNHVDLKGTCPPERFDQLLKTLGWPESELMFQLSREAVYLGDAEFRRWAMALNKA